MVLIEVTTKSGEVAFINPEQIETLTQFGIDVLVGMTSSSCYKIGSTTVASFADYLRRNGCSVELRG